jgi:hypothetical protein
VYTRRAGQIATEPGLGILDAAAIDRDLVDRSRRLVVLALPDRLLLTAPQLGDEVRFLLSVSVLKSSQRTGAEAAAPAGEPASTEATATSGLAGITR